MSTLAQRKQKQERLAHANALIRIIGSYGRRFFWYGGNSYFCKDSKQTYFEPADRYATLELRRGKVYLIDDYTQKAVYTHTTPFANRWVGFSHGGTLRSLIESMRDYVMHGTPISRWKIVMPQSSGDGNIWGYSDDAALKVREAAFKLPIVAAE